MTDLLKLASISLIVFNFTACAFKTAPLVQLDQASQSVPPETVSVLIKGYTPQSGNTYQNLFASNFSVRVNGGKMEYSTSRDGLSDTLKANLQSKFGFTIQSPESVVAGFQDLVLFLSGIDLTQSSRLRCAPTQMGSSSGDLLTYTDSRTGSSTALGLRDCVKTYMGLNPKTFDNNANGIPDYLELRCGMSPTNKIQSAISTASDGMSNLEKCRRHIPITESATTEASQYLAYQYLTVANADGTMNLKVSNIPILNGGEDNFIAFYIVEANSSTKVTSLYSAFVILKRGLAGTTIETPYWATAPAKFTNQQINLP